MRTIKQQPQPVPAPFPKVVSPPYPGLWLKLPGPSATRKLVALDASAAVPEWRYEDSASRGLLHVELPGVSRADAFLSVDPAARTMTVRGVSVRTVTVRGVEEKGVDGRLRKRLRVVAEGQDGRRVHVVAKAFRKTFWLNGRVDVDRVCIHDFHDGVLTVSLPYREQRTTRHHLR